MIDLAHFEACLVLARKYNARGLNVTEAGFEVVFEPVTPAKEKPENELEPEGKMPTRAEIEERVKRMAQGGPPK